MKFRILGSYRKTTGLRLEDQHRGTTTNTIFKILSFNDFNLSSDLLMGLSDMGFSKATPIQIQAIPAVLEGKDLLASAQTGTGKTAAFAVPLIEKLAANKKNGIRALILAPTRELAMQIDEQFWTIGYHTGVTTASVYGGTDWGAQEQAIRDGVNVLVATPGRLLDHIKVSNVDFSQLEFLVLDEADRMLDMGFIPDVLTIIRRLPKKRQTLLFSATLSDKIEGLAKELTINPVRINISSSVSAEGVDQRAYKVNDDAKLDLVLHLFDTENVISAIVFTATKRGADSLSRALRKKSVKVAAMHGDRDQKEREATLGDFKAGRINVIVATDVMARGIDITGVSHVINFDVPHDVDDYIHRIGRTARAEMKGTAMTLVTRQDNRYFQQIKDKMGDRLKIIELTGDQSSMSDNRDHQNDDQHSRSRGNQNRNQGRSRPNPVRKKPELGSKPKAPEFQDKTKSDAGNSTSGPNQPQPRLNPEKPPIVPKKPSAPRPPARNRPPVPPKRNQSRDSSGPKPGSKADYNKKNQNDHEARRYERIQQVSNPFQEKKLVQPSEQKEKIGFWNKIKSVFGSEK
ncbi:MAG TPA: ATP-dependent helicase [Bacteroidetes bacterium]|nr:ATP-dependent helicase [Bacteroidota bacterium]